MKSAVLISNPAASQFTGGLHRTVMQSLRRRYDVEALWPTSADGARSEAAHAVTTGIHLVVAMGGDGIVHHVGQSLVGTETTLGIIPAGTTNVLARVLGLPRRPAAAAKMLSTDFESTLSPALDVDLHLAGGSRRRIVALFAVGMGPDAAVVERAETEPYRKYRFGGVHYARTAVSTVWSDIRKRRPGAILSIRGEERGVVGVMAQFHPIYTYFGRVPLRIDTQDPDPMSVLAIERLPLRRTARIARGALTRSGLDDVPGFAVYRHVDRFAVMAATPVEVQADGELLGKAVDLRVSYRPGALRVAVPSRHDRDGSRSTSDRESRFLRRRTAS